MQKAIITVGKLICSSCGEAVVVGESVLLEHVLAVVVEAGIGGDEKCGTIEVEDIRLKCQVCEEAEEEEKDGKKGS